MRYFREINKEIVKKHFICFFNYKIMIRNILKMLTENYHGNEIHGIWKIDYKKEYVKDNVTLLKTKDIVVMSGSCGWAVIKMIEYIINRLGSLH